MNKYRYFKFLTSKYLTGDGQWYWHYTKLIQDLFRTEFKFSFSIPTDADRADDGIYLRSLYFSESNLPAKDIEAIHEMPCTVLEMMIGLSIRIESFMNEDQSEDHPEHWFWEMINNLGLADMQDRNYNEQIVLNAIDNFVNRNYDRNGKGGLFPLKHSLVDQRTIPIWDQMLMYINERY